MTVDVRMVAVVVVIAGLATAAGCGGDSVAETAAPAQQVYFDTPTRTAVVADASQDVPAVNPATGRRTLMPALYCAKCGEWRAAPPLEELQRNPRGRDCAKCNGPLSAEGPLPAESN